MWHNICRWCVQPITHADGRPDRRRNWHPTCVTAYNAARDIRGWAQAVYEAAHGRCRACGAACEGKVGRTQFSPGTLLHPGGCQWEADHILPLADGGTWELSNGQLLCVPCHRHKTAAENSRRFKKVVPPGPLEALMERPLPT